MNNITRFFSVLILALGASGAASADTSYNCSVPLNVVCNVSNPLGIERVVVTLETGLGPVDVVDKAFACDTQVQVAWDPIVPGGSMNVTTCSSGVAPNLAGYTGDDKGVLDLLSDGTVNISPASTPPYRKGAKYSEQATFNLAEVVVRGVPETAVRFSRAKALINGQGPQTENDTYCCNEGTLDGCFAVNLLAQCGEGLDFVSCATDKDGNTKCESFPN